MCRAQLPIADRTHRVRHRPLGHDVLFGSSVAVDEYGVHVICRVVALQ